MAKATSTRAIDDLYEKANQASDQYQEKLRAEIAQLRNDNQHLRDNVRRANDTGNQLAEDNGQIASELEQAGKDLRKAQDKLEASNETLEACQESLTRKTDITDAKHAKMHRNLKEVYHNVVALHELVHGRISDVGNAEVKRQHVALTDAIVDRLTSMDRVMVDKQSTEADLMYASNDLDDIPGVMLPARPPPQPPAPPRRHHGNKVGGGRSPTPAPPPRANDPHPRQGRMPGSSGGNGGAAPGAGVGGVDDNDGARSRSRTPSRSESPDYVEELANQLGIKMVFPNDVAKVMHGVTQEWAAELVDSVDELVNNREYEPIAVCEPTMNLTDPTNKHFDPNFTHPPTKWTRLRRGVRDIWKFWKGFWTDHNGNALPKARPHEITEVTYDANSVHSYDTFTRVFGSHCYQLWPAAVLRGPSAWVNVLPNARIEQHQERQFTEF